MSHVPDTELFSAYLDGELTADEQVRVEQILATNPEARQLLEELRALGSTLQSLPQEKLNEDLSTRVLEVAERRMLLPARPFDETTASNKPSAGRAAGTMQPSDADSIGWLGVPWREISWRGMLSQRALIWSGVVVATAIIISYTSPPPPKANREIARSNQPPSSPAPAVSGEERRGNSASDGSWDVPAGQQRKLRSEDKLAESRKAAVGEDRSEDAGALRANEKAIRLEEKKAAPIDALADAKPAAMPRPTKLAAPPAASQEEPRAYAARQQLMNGTGFDATNNSSSAEAILAGNRQLGQASPNRRSGQVAPAAIRVGLDVSALAMQNHVFEDLLARSGLSGTQNSTNDKARALKNEGNLQTLTATANALRGSVAKSIPDERNDQRSDAGGLQQQQARKSMTYEFDVSPEQLVVILDQIRARADSFSAPQLTENYNFAANSSYGNNFSGGMGGGILASRRGEQQQAKSDAGENNPRRLEAAQPQAAAAAAPESAKQTASPAASAPKQHVVFVLHVVDRLAPASGASQTPAPAATTPAKQ